MAKYKPQRINKSFNDGICSIYTAERRTLKEKIGDFCFENETVGIKAFSELNILGKEIERVISIPLNSLITKSSVVAIEKQLYGIELIQSKDTFPKSLRLTLSASPIAWSEHD